ncbi:MAG: hypothetical protein EOQ56_14975 [Mesorhizobium sp.]|nr:MAG: hypothetical protein EOQ56_14975 [Mesorhizobium sp.]
MEAFSACYRSEPNFMVVTLGLDRLCTTFRDQPENCCADLDFNDPALRLGCPKQSLSLTL